MGKPLATYSFDVLTEDEREQIIEGLHAQSWEQALLDGKMLRFDRRPRFSQMFRLKVEKSDTPVVKSISKDAGVFMWLEAPPDDE